MAGRLDRRAAVAVIVGALWLAPAAARVDGPLGADARVVDSREAHGLAAAAAVQVMGLGCGVLQSGSGTATSGGAILTNRHVVEGAGMVRLTRRHVVALADADAAGDADLALLRAVVPAVGVEPAFGDPGPGAQLTVAGYPVGRGLRSLDARVVDYVDGAPLGQPGRLMRLDVPLEAGMSGGPALDANGRLAGVLFATDEVSGYGLVIPVSTVREALAAPASPLPAGC